MGAGAQASERVSASRPHNAAPESRSEKKGGSAHGGVPRQKRGRRKPITVAALKLKLWPIFSEYFRRVHTSSTVGRCYTCDTLLPWHQLQTGHFVGGRHSAVLFNEEVCRLQCVRCNVMLRGNYQIFTLRMIDEVGKKKVEELLDLRWRTVKFTRADLEALILYYRNLLRGLQSSQQ